MPFKRSEDISQVDAAGGRNEGFTVLDGAAMVVAAAVASVHMRSPVRQASGAGWGLVWITFAGVAITSAGTFVYLARRFGRRTPGYPRAGDRLWGVLGLPWVVTSPLRTSPGSVVARSIDLYGFALTLGVGATSLLVLAVVWKIWVLTPPGARIPAGGAAPWTDRLGMALSVAWPLQCGFLAVVLDTEVAPLAR